MMRLTALPTALMKHGFCFNALLVCLLGASAAAAQELPRTAAGLPDLSGYWMISFGPMPPARPATAVEQALLDRLAPDSVLLADSGLVEFAPGDYGGLQVHPEASAAVAGYDPEVQRSVSATCLPPSIAYAMQGPFPMEFFQGTELLVIKMEYYDQVRVVFLDSDTHPDDWPHSRTGHSIGRWDGDELVVETRFLQPSTLFNNGLDHSEELALTERFRLSEDGDTLAVSQEFSDPAVFAGQGARVFSLQRGEGHVYPYDCDPSYGAAIESRTLE